jgi:hypothetical protein
MSDTISSSGGARKTEAPTGGRAMAKIKVWGVKVYVMGADRWDHEWFASKEERDEYYNNQKTPCEKLRCRMMDEAEYKEAEYSRKNPWW